MAHPVVLAAGVEVGEELRARAIPAVARVVSRTAPRPRVVFLGPRNKPARRLRLVPPRSKDRVGLLLIRSDVSLALPDGAGPAFCALGGLRTGP